MSRLWRRCVIASIASIAFIAAGNKGDGSIFTESIHFVVSANTDQNDFSLAQELEDHPVIKAHAECPEPFKPAVNL
jgi:hypothetical protein